MNMNMNEKLLENRTVYYISRDDFNILAPHIDLTFYGKILDNGDIFVSEHNQYAFRITNNEIPRDVDFGNIVGFRQDLLNKAKTFAKNITATYLSIDCELCSKEQDGYCLDCEDSFVLYSSLLDSNIKALFDFQ